MISSIARLGFSFSFSKVAANRQDVFDHRLVIATQTKRLIATEHDQPTTQIAHISARSTPFAATKDAVAGTLDRISNS